MDVKEKHKATVNRFIDEIRTVTHAMIDGEHKSESPVALVREAIEYLDERYQQHKDEEAAAAKE